MKPAMVLVELTRAHTTFVAEIPGQICPLCGSDMVNYRNLKTFELAAARWLATSGLQSKEAFRFMRKALELKAHELASLLGTTKETISRWENGKHAIDRTAYATLATLIIDESQGQRSTLRQRLEAMDEEPEPPTEPVHLEVAA